MTSLKQMKKNSKKSKKNMVKATKKGGFRRRQKPQKVDKSKSQNLKNSKRKNRTKKAVLGLAGLAAALGIGYRHLQNKKKSAEEAEEAAAEAEELTNKKMLEIADKTILDHKNKGGAQQAFADELKKFKNYTISESLAKDFYRGYDKKTRMPPKTAENYYNSIVKQKMSETN